MQLKIADTDDLSGFWYGSQAFALKGEPCFLSAGAWSKSLSYFLSPLPTEDVCMGACLKEKKRKFIVVLLPSHEPIRFDMTFPLPLMVSLQ
jgi:hypothetical protein